MQRIRYKQTMNGTEISNKMIAGNHAVVVNLNPENNEFFILNIDLNEIVFKGQGKTKPDALKRIKKSLKDLGVQFEEEMRNKIETQRV